MRLNLLTAIAKFLLQINIHCSCSCSGRGSTAHRDCRSDYNVKSVFSTCVSRCHMTVMSTVKSLFRDWIVIFVICSWTLIQEVAGVWCWIVTEAWKLPCLVQCPSEIEEGCGQCKKRLQEVTLQNLSNSEIEHQRKRRHRKTSNCQVYIQNMCKKISSQASSVFCYERSLNRVISATQYPVTKSSVYRGWEPKFWWDALSREFEPRAGAILQFLQLFSLILKNGSFCKAVPYLKEDIQGYLLI